MTSQTFVNRILLVTAIVIAFLGIWMLHDTLLLAFLSIILAVGLSLPARSLERRGFKRGWALTIAVVGFFFAVALLILILLPTLITELGTLLNAIPAALEKGVTLYEESRDKYEIVGNILPAFSELTQLDLTDEFAAQLQSLFTNVAQTAIPAILSGLGVVSTLLANLALMLFVSVFFLTDPLSYVRASLYLVPKHNQDSLLNLWNELYHTLNQWLKAQFTSITITIALVWFVLGLLLGMPNALSVAVIAGFATFIPNIGAFLPLIPILIFNLADDPSRLIYILPAYLIIQLLESNIITPALVRAQLHIPAGGLMLFQIIATVLFGTMGILLAVPLLAVLIAVVREVYSYGILGLQNEEVHLAVDDDGQVLRIHPADTSEPQKPHADQSPDPLAIFEG